MQRQIVHCDLDTFFVSVARLQNSRLIGKPVLIGGSSSRSVVASCSYEARRFGVHSAMPLAMARKLCPEAIVLKGDFERYTYYSKMVTEILEEQLPIVEKASIDEHYIDMTGMDKFFGTWKLTQEMRNRIISETGLPISFGLSINKTVSKIATGEAKPNGERKVNLGTEKSFLAPLSIKKIPGVGDKTYMFLSNMGISKINTLQQMPVLSMRQVLGENGVQIWNKANGIDHHPVLPYEEQKSMSREITFEQDTIDEDFLRIQLLKLVDELTFSLRQQQKLTACVSVKIRYANFDTHQSQAKISYTSSDKSIAKKALELFKKLHQRRMLIRLIGLRFTDLITGSYQTNLFEDTELELNLSNTLDKIRNRFGFQVISRGVKF